MGTKFTEVLNKFKSIPTPRKLVINGTPEMVIDGSEARISVYTLDFDNLMKQLKRGI